MIKFKRQTPRSTRMDETENINIFLKGFEFGIVTSNYWGNFTDKKESEEYHKEHTKDNPLIEIELDGLKFELTLEEFKDKLRMVLK